jgi:hypothetical protein
MPNGRCDIQGRLRPRPDVAALTFPFMDIGLVLPPLCDTLVLAISQLSQCERYA